MKKVSNYPVCSALCSYLDGKKDIVLRGTWIKGDITENATISTITTRMTVIRAWSVAGETIHTREEWEHDNGYRATFSLISKAEFLQAIQ